SPGPCGPGLCRARLCPGVRALGAVEARLDHPEPDPCHADDQYRRDDEVLQVADVLLDLFPVVAEKPAGADEDRVPDEASGGGVDHEGGHRHLAEARRDGDQAADDWHDAADHDRKAAVLVEPLVRLVDVLFLEPEPLAPIPDDPAHAMLAEVVPDP